MNILLLLAYNEELFIRESIIGNLDLFDKIIVVNDNSKDTTRKIVEEISKKNKNKIELINNPKNFGPGKSFDIGLKYSLNLDFDYLIKSDGDNQFRIEDIKKILEIAKKNHLDFIKCDRFWTEGISGNIPLIRYIGNAFASVLIKFVTSNVNINDPLNGLFLFSKKAAVEIKIPKLFFNYGYPFFINYTMSKLNYSNTELKLRQFKNIVSYGGQKSNLNALFMFFKLSYFSLKSFVSLITVKIKFSKFQTSGILDFVAIFSFITSIYCLIKVILVRLFNFDNNQGAWIILSIIFFMSTFLIIGISRKNISEHLGDSFSYIN